MDNDIGDHFCVCPRDWELVRDCVDDDGRVHDLAIRDFCTDMFLYGYAHDPRPSRFFEIHLALFVSRDPCRLLADGRATENGTTS